MHLTFFGIAEPPDVDEDAPRHVEDLRVDGRGEGRGGRHPMTDGLQESQDNDYSVVSKQTESSTGQGVVP